MCLNIVDIQTRSIQWYTPQDKETFYDFCVCMPTYVNRTYSLNWLVQSLEFRK
jgi:hypothetical protein